MGAKKQYILSFLLFMGLASLHGEVRLPVLLSDGMVLQRNTEVRIWGWADQGEEVKVTFDGKRYRTRTGSDGRWQLLLPPREAGGPYDLVVEGKNRVTVKDVLFGDVWICSGQSNMVLPMERVKERYPKEIAEADYPEIRHLFIPTANDLKGPKEDLPPAQWKKATPENVLGFSAAAYFFAKALYNKYHIPIGLVNASVGGTPIQAWISEEGLMEFPVETERLNRNRDAGPMVSRGRRGGRGRGEARPPDRGLSGELKWYDPAYVPKGWWPINIPGYWEDQGVRDLNGVVWYRREIRVPASMTGVPAKLFMGRIIDADEVYVNGNQVGRITYQYPPRRYELKAGVLKPGKNIIVIRVTNNFGKGGFVPDKPYYLTANGEELDLKGTWQYKVGQVFPPTRFFRGGGFSPQNQPMALYNAMIAPLLPHRIKGFIWYQGESNAGNPDPYESLMETLIRDWRLKWGQGDLPFIFVQLANYMDVDYLPAESNWAELRDAQRRSLSVPNTAMAVAIDLGEWNDIHPLNKSEVGRRLALGAMRLAYGDAETVSSGPLFRSYGISGDAIILHFDHCGSGLVSNDGEPLNRFEIAGADGVFHRADARIAGTTVEVRKEGIEHPEYVRYAWSDNPMGANLYNREGLPASPFQTGDPEEPGPEPWHGKKCAVVLSYDDGYDQQLDNAIPLLDSAGIKGTFYISGSFSAFLNREQEWVRAAREGHELGNHTLFHPCDAQLQGREWVSPDYDLSKYSLRRMEGEIRMNQAFLESLDGKEERTFAYTCGDTRIKGEPFIQLVVDVVAGARTSRQQMQPMGEIDPYHIGSYVVSGQSGDELINLVKKAMESGSLLVFQFHGVGGGHDLNVSLEDHRRLVWFLKAHEDEIWTTTMLKAVENIRFNRSN